MKRILFLSTIAAVALLGTSCTPSGGPIYPMTIGSVWNMSSYTLYGTTLASLDTMTTGTQTNTALEKANLSNGREVVKFKNDATVHYKALDTTITTTSYSYVAEVGDTIFSYTSLDDTIGTPVMRSNPAAGQTWAEGSVIATVVGQENVTVAAGTYRKAWKIKTITNIGGVTVEMFSWYARGVGNVKMHYEGEYQGHSQVFNEELTSATIK
ncbi:MAG: hypothetical protein NTX53_02015 [candidate division WOR-3 bacterium]|nr:hypothetical protein [candidate division WOR-3 bacterium]